MSNPCANLADNTEVACSGNYSGCSRCYCAGGQMYVLCDPNVDTCSACSSSEDPCSSSTSCTSTSDGGTCYSCSDANYDPSTTVCPSASVVGVSCSAAGSPGAGGPPLGCDSGSTSCSDGFRAYSRAGPRRAGINAARPGLLATVYARVRAKMLGHGHPNTHLSHVPARRGPARRPVAHHPARFNGGQRGRFTAVAPPPPVPAHGPYGRPQYAAAVGGCSGMALGPDRLAQAERKMWSLANTGDGTYNYNSDAAMTPASDSGFYEAPAPMDYQTFVEDAVFGQETRLNHQRWATEVAPWSAGRARKVDTLEEENYVDWMGIRGPHNAVEVANPSQITELNPSDLARWGNRTRVGRTGGEPYECAYNWQG